MKEIESFYENLYASHDEDNKEAFNDKLTDEERENLEGYITIEECSNVLKTFPAGNSPGDDGFTAEFYNCFFDLVSRDLPISQRRGVITLVPKDDSCLSERSN